MSNLSFGSSGSSSSSTKAHLPHVSTLSRPGTRPGIRPVIRDSHLEEWLSVSVSCAFRPPAFSSWASLPARELGPPYGRLTRETNRFSGLWRVFHVPHTRDTTGFGCPLYAEASGALTTDLHSPVAACRFSAARPCTPVPHPSPGGDRDDASTRVHLCSPIRRFPSPAIPGWHRNRLGFSPGLRTPPPRRRRRTPGWGQALSTCPGLHLRHQPNLQPVNPLALSSFVSHVQVDPNELFAVILAHRGLLRRGK